MKLLALVQPSGCPSRSADLLRRNILFLQESCTCFEKCRCPVIVAIHGPCFGAGVDIIAACDIRYCSSDAIFSVKEVDVGLAADLGSLQRLPSIIGHGIANLIGFIVEQRQ